MFNTFLHFAMFAYQFKLGLCVVIRPRAIAIVEVIHQGRVIYSNTNKHSSSTLR